MIRPVPLDVSKDEDGNVHHVVFKRENSQQFDESSDFAYMEPDRLHKRYKRSADNDDIYEDRSRSKRAIPNIIYPEILVIVDYDGYRLHGGDNVQVINVIVNDFKGVENPLKINHKILNYH